MANYQDSQVVQFIKYGFLLGHDGKTGTTTIPKNHTGGRFYPEEMQRILHKEVSLDVSIGPFKTSPFRRTETFLSPLNSIPKKESGERRLILDLSFPEGNSINDGIDKDWYLGEFQKLTLPSVDKLAERIMHLGAGCKVWKIDLVRAYRQIYLDPVSINKVGFVFDGMFLFDTTLSMGSQLSAKCCQRVTSVVVFIFTNQGFFAINYLDDLGSAETEECAQESFDRMLELLHMIDLKEAVSKSVALCMVMVFLGILVDTIRLTLSILEQKWTEMIDLAKSWLKKSHASLKQTQQLVGLLNFACHCVKSAQVYLSRILNYLCTLPRNGEVEIPPSVKLDIKWWVNLARFYNGMSFMTNNEWSEPDAILSSDSCLRVGGAYFNGRYTHWQYLQVIHTQNFNINQLECLMVVIAIAIWMQYLKRQKIAIYCDNQVTVQSINSGASRDVVIQKCLRMLHILLISAHCELKAFYLEGENNRISDALSRIYTNNKFKVIFKKLMEGINKKETHI